MDDRDEFWVSTVIGHNRDFFEALFELNPDVDLGRDGFVYYARLDNAFVKVGFVHEARRLIYRLKAELHVEYPFRVVELIALERGGYLREQFRHYQFSHLRQYVLGEQFQTGTDLKIFMKTLVENEDAETQALRRSISFGKEWRHGALVLGDLYAEVLPPPGETTDWFFRGDAWGVLKTLKTMKNCGYLETEDRLELLAKPGSGAGLNRLGFLADFIAGSGGLVTKF